MIKIKIWCTNPLLFFGGRRIFVIYMTTNFHQPTFSLRRIMLFGIPGSGKSTFALKLSRILHLPLFHLDKYFFLEGWKERDYDEFLDIQSELVKQEYWIIDGNATRSLEMRYRRADMILYFNFNRVLCLYRIFKRLIHKHPHLSDRADGCTEKVRRRLITYLWGFPKRVKPQIEHLREKYPETTFYEIRSEKELKELFHILKKHKKYVFKPYNPDYPILFLKERERISPILSKAISIEHIGSTAVPGLGGKGIIDIGVAARKKDMRAISKMLKKLGYEFRSKFSTPERLFFVIYLPDSEEESRGYHIHMAAPESQVWKELVGFREYLIQHPDDAEEYAKIKERASDVSNQDGETYRQMKEPIIQKVLSSISKK